VNPTLHIQAVRATLAIGEFELLGHTTQVDSSVAPTVVEYFPAAQSAHTALPVAILYFPATQAVHAPPSGPVNPTLQVQEVRATLAIGEFELLGHTTQVDSSVATTVVEYFPAAQSAHTALPVATLYLPATQAVHAPPSGPVNPALHNVAIDEHGHPVTCTSPKCRYAVGAEMMRYRPLSGVVHVTCAMKGLLMGAGRLDAHVGLTPTVVLSPIAIEYPFKRSWQQSARL
jgi:hypothetical protein